MPICNSTNDIAMDLINKKYILEGTIITTSYQFAGKGQMGNQWESETDKNLMCSIIIKPHFLDIYKQFYLNIIVSLAVLDLLSSELMTGLKIKWPNDIYFFDKKVGGILIETILKDAKIDYAILGIGLNINQELFLYPNAISLSNITKQKYRLDSMLENICEYIEYRYLLLKSGKFLFLRQEYLSKMYRYQEIHFFNIYTKKGEKKTIQGQILGIDETGKLAIQSKESIKYFTLKEIVFL